MTNPPLPSPLDLARGRAVRITKNAAECARCGDVIESTHRHDFVSCKCGAIFTDGGREYLRRGGESLDLIIDRSEHSKRTAEEVFKSVVNYLLDNFESPYARGPWPGPMVIDHSRNLNGDQTRWRREVLLDRGYRKTFEGVGGRWYKPAWCPACGLPPDPTRHYCGTCSP